MHYRNLEKGESVQAGESLMAEVMRPGLDHKEWVGFVYKERRQESVEALGNIAARRETSSHGKSGEGQSLDLI